MQFAGTFTTDITQKVTLSCDFLESIKKERKIVFCHGDNAKSKEDVLSELENFGAKNIDIQFDTDLMLVGESYSDGLYERAVFDGEAVDFSEIVERFSELEEVVSVRKIGKSELFLNQKIAVDFVY